MTEAGDYTGSDRQREKLSAWIALAATHPARSGVEVTTEQMIEFRNGTLSGREREKVLAALDSSDATYEEWLALNRFLDDDTGKDAVARPRRYLPWAGGIVAAGLAIAFVFFIRGPDGLESSLDRSYEELLSATGPSTSPLSFVDGADAGTGFAASSDATRRVAMSAGLWTGAAAMRGQSSGPYPTQLLPPGVSDANLADRPWSRTDGAAYAALGRWLVLVVAACEQPAAVDAAFWRQQSDIAVSLRASLESGAVEAAVPRRQLDEMLTRMGQLSEGGNPVRPCRNLVSAAARIAASADRRALFSAPEG
jgi:hypothetical protein